MTSLLLRVRLWRIRIRISILRNESDYHASLARKFAAESYDLERQSAAIRLQSL